MILKALNFAREKHEGQFRKDEFQRPYIVHPVGVYGLLFNAGIENEDVLCAALLHDTIEDTNTTFDELAIEFNIEVAGLVGEVTNNPAISKAKQKLMQLEDAPYMTNGARLVRFADKINNLNDIAEFPPVGWDKAKKDRYVEFCKELIPLLNIDNEYLNKKFKEAIKKLEKA